MSPKGTFGTRSGALAQAYGPKNAVSSPYDILAVERMHSAPQPPKGMIRLSGPLEHDNIVNGDGLRAVVWTQGCPNHCKECQNPETWDFCGGMLIDIDEVKRGMCAAEGCGGRSIITIDRSNTTLVPYALHMEYEHTPFLSTSLVKTYVSKM